MVSSSQPPSDKNHHDPTPFDYRWLDKRFKTLMSRVGSLEAVVAALEGVVTNGSEQAIGSTRHYYSTVEFAGLVGRSEYTVREWCRLERIHAEKAETGRGDAKSWKIAAEELQRYRDHGLLPLRYKR